MLTVDLNCDMGEGFGPWPMGNDAELMRYVSSANIACGFHAGDASTMRKTVRLAIENGVAVGAHPGWPDLQGFGRRSITISASETFDIVLYQISALRGICEANGTRLHHVKPHGAMYNQAASDPLLARAIVDAVKANDPGLILYGLSGSQLIAEARAAGLNAASEVFADRTYQKDGSLNPRTEPDALIDAADDAAAQALGMVLEKTVTSREGDLVEIEPDTICIHGDGENAVALARSINEALTSRGITITAPKALYAE